MKRTGRKYLSLLLTLLLLVSMLAMSASGEGTGTGTVEYKATIKECGEDVSYKDIGINLIRHTEGVTGQSVSHSAASFNSNYFDFSTFPAEFRSGLYKAYINAGYKEQINISTKASIVVIPQYYPTGIYAPAFVYTSGRASWKVTVVNSTVREGSFGKAPIKVEILWHYLGTLN